MVNMYMICLLFVIVWISLGFRVIADVVIKVSALSVEKRYILNVIKNIIIVRVVNSLLIEVVSELIDAYSRKTLKRSHEFDFRWVRKMLMQLKYI